MVVIIVAAIVVPRLVDLNRYRGDIESGIESALGGNVVLGNISWGIANGIWLKADLLTIRDATAVPLDVDLSELHAKVAIRPLFSKQVVITDLELERPVVKLKTGASRESGDRDESHKATMTDSIGEAVAPASLPVQIRVERVQITDGRFTLVDSLIRPDTPHGLVSTDVNAVITNVISDKDMTFRLELRAPVEMGSGVIECAGTLSGLTGELTFTDPSIEATLTLTDISTTAIDPYLKDSAIGKRISGSVSLEMEYQGDFGDNHRATGTIDLTDLAYTDRSLWNKPLPGRDTKIDYEISIGPDSLNVRRLELDMHGLAIRTSAAICDWRESPVIKNGDLSGEITLADVIPLIPWKRLKSDRNVLYDMLKSGGTIKIKDCAFAEFVPGEMLAKPKSVLSLLDATLRLSDVSLKPWVTFPRLSGVSGNVAVKNGELIATDVTGRFHALSLPTIDLRFGNLTEKPRITLSAEGPMRLDDTESAAIDQLLNDYGLGSPPVGICGLLRFERYPGRKLSGRNTSRKPGRPLSFTAPEIGGNRSRRSRGQSGGFAV
jgi:hypothetical protein